MSRSKETTKTARAVWGIGIPEVGARPAARASVRVFWLVLRQTFSMAVSNATSIVPLQAPAIEYLAGTQLASMSSTALQPVRFFLFYMNGCQGSTASMAILGSLLRCLGVNIALREFEWFKPSKNALYQQHYAELRDEAKAWRATLEQALGQASTWNASFLVNIQHGETPLHIIAPMLKRYGVRTAAAYRENRLDWVVCQVRDCFTSHAAGVAMLDGKPSSLCFDRRFTNATGLYQAHVHTWSLANLLEPKQQLEAASLHNFGLGTVHPVAYEKLAAAQYPHSSVTGHLLQSVGAWRTVLTDLQVPHSHESVYRCLAPLEGTYGLPGSQRKVIHNFDSVSSFMHRNLSRSVWMLRP